MEHDIQVAGNRKLSILIGVYVLVSCYNRRALTEKDLIARYQRAFHICTFIFITYSRGKRDQ
jgi:hypothetical protein